MNFCNCNSELCGVDSGIIHYEFNDSDLNIKLPEYPDGIHAGLNIVKLMDPNNLLVNVKVAKAFRGEFQLLNSHNILISTQQPSLENNILNLLPFKLTSLNVIDNRNNQTEPLFVVEMKFEVPERGIIELQQKLPFKDIEVFPYFAVQYRCAHDRCCRWGVCVACRYRCQYRICSSSGRCSNWNDTSNSCFPLVCGP